MNNIIGIVSTDFKKIQKCFYEVAPLLYKDLYKTKIGRKECILKYYCVDKLKKEIESDLSIRHVHSTDIISKFIDEEYFKRFINVLYSNQIKNINTKKDEITLIEINNKETLDIVKSINGHIIYISSEHRPIKLITNKIKNVMNYIQNKQHLYLYYTQKDYWYQDNKPINYMKSFVVDFMKDTNNHLIK